jgi:hypothetical protein
VTRQVKNARSAGDMCGVAIKSEQTGGRTDPGDLALGNAAIPTNESYRVGCPADSVLVAAGG